MTGAGRKANARASTTSVLTRELDDAEQEIRALRVRMVDVEDTLAISDAFVSEVESDRDAEWSRARVVEWAARFREARRTMIHRDLPDPKARIV